jgi:hypothetical protein
VCVCVRACVYVCSVFECASVYACVYVCTKMYVCVQNKRLTRFRALFDRRSIDDGMVLECRRGRSCCRRRIEEGRSRR